MVNEQTDPASDYLDRREAIVELERIDAAAKWGSSCMGVFYARNELRDIRTAREALAGARLAGRVEQAREDAELIEANTVCYGSDGQLLRPRKDNGDTMGLPYAAAIRARIAEIEKEGGDMTLEEGVAALRKVTREHGGLNFSVEDWKAEREAERAEIEKEPRDDATSGGRGLVCGGN
jgi:hypothetical protein